MKEFWSRYSYDVVKTFIFHMVFGMFGLACVPFFSSDMAKICLSVFCILFMMFLLYGDIWKLAGKDIAAGHSSSKYTGLYIGLLGSSVDFLLLILKTVSVLIPGTPDFFKAVVVFVNFVYNGLYRGFMVIELSNGTQFGSSILYFAFTAIPVILATTFGYMLGLKNLHLTNIFVPENPEEKEIKAEAKKKKKLGKND